MKHPVADSPAYFFSLAGLLLVLLSACGEKGSSNTNSHPLVEDKVAALFTALQVENYDAALAQYDEGFFKTQSPQAWREKLEALQAESGSLREWHLRRSQADARVSGTFFLHEYTSVHTGNKRLHHLMTFLWSVNDEKLLLLGHKITPWQAGGD